MTLSEILKSKFTDYFNGAPDFVVKAPGRVNLIGEHTDYNDGFVLPCAIDYGNFIAASAREDDEIHVLACDYAGQTDVISLNQPLAQDANVPWRNYVRGVIQQLQLQGHKLKGCNIAISGNVPQGAGLSSSAALEVGVGHTLNLLCELGLREQHIALIGQAAENQFVGCQCGIMDQLISACGRDNKAMLIDCRSLALEEVAIPDSLAVLMVNSNVKRGLVDSAYNTRREQCTQGARLLQQASLRDVPISHFEAHKHTLDKNIAKRVEHVLYENERTLALAQALNRDDRQAISHLMAQSHASMRDLFEITTPEIDTLVTIISEVIGEHGGVRMTGGGFGGCVVALVEHTMLADVCDAVKQQYPELTGLNADIYHSRPVKGVALI